MIPKVAAKTTNVVYSGWMTKSPPERKRRSIFQIFRAQWKKCYFVLAKPPGSLPHQYQMHYYRDQCCTTRKGSIDLEQCEKIIEAPASDVFSHLFAIKTYYKSTVRTYYLAADTEQEKETWIQWLCHVCGVKPEGKQPDMLDSKPAEQEVARQTSIVASCSSIVTGRMKNPQRPAASSTTATTSTLSVTPQGGGGIQSMSPRVVCQRVSNFHTPTENNTTRQPRPVDRRDRMESVPECEVPASAHKLHNEQSTGAQKLEDVFVPGLYDHSLVQGLPEVSSHTREIAGNKVTVDENYSSYYAPPSYGHRTRSSPNVATASWYSAVCTGQVCTGQGYAACSAAGRDLTQFSLRKTPPAQPTKQGHLHFHEQIQTLQYVEDEETHHPLSVLRDLPPFFVDSGSGLVYIDLAFSESNQELPRFSHSHKCHDIGSATAYSQIDFVKTQAVNTTKRMKKSFSYPLPLLRYMCRHNVLKESVHTLSG